MTRLRRLHEAGFTLIEVLCIIMIIGILAGIGLNSFLSQTDKPRESGAQQALTASYKVGYGEWMDAGQGLEPAYPPVSSLVQALQNSEPQYEYITASFNGTDPSRKRISVFREDPRSGAALAADQVIYCTGVRANRVICLGADERGGWTTLASGGGLPLIGPDDATAQSTSDIVYAIGSTARAAAGLIIDGKGTRQWPDENVPTPTTPTPPAETPAFLTYTFEPGLQGWTEDDTAITVSAEEGRTGQQGLRVAYSRQVAATGSLPYAAVKTGKVFKAGNTYTVTAWVRGTSVRHRLAVNRNNTSVIASSGDVTLTRDWQQVQFTFTPASTSTDSEIWMQLSPVSATSAGQYVEIDDVRVVETAPTLAVNTVEPAITGTFRTGQDLVVDPGQWTATSPITYTYRWQRCTGAGTGCTTIAGATSPTYHQQPADIGMYVRAQVTATTLAGGRSVYSKLPYTQTEGVTWARQSAVQHAGVIGETSISIAQIRSSAQPGDVLILTIASTNQSDAPLNMPGWTRVAANMAVAGSGATGSLHTYRISLSAVTSDVLTVDLPDGTGTNQFIITPIRIRGADPSNPIATSAMTATTTAGQATLPALTLAEANMPVISSVQFSGEMNSTTSINPLENSSVLTNVRHSGSLTSAPRAYSAVFLTNNASAGPWAARTVTTTGTPFAAGNARAHVFAIKPAP